MKGIFAVVLLAGCLPIYADDTESPPYVPPPAPPLVIAMSPQSGPYGTPIVIEGKGFGSVSGLVVPGVDPIASPLTIDLWTDSRIELRVPFPAVAGALTIRGPGGETTTPAFTPDISWTPGPSAKLAHVYEARAFAGGTLAALGDVATGVQVVVFAGDTATTVPIANVAASSDPRMPPRVRLLADDAGDPEVIAMTALGHIVVFSLADPQPAPLDTGITGTLVAAGRDATGAYAWIATAGTMSTAATLARVRPTTAGMPWMMDRGPITAPLPLDAQLADDGTLVLAYSQRGSDIFDNTATLAIWTLAPTATTFTTEYPDPFFYDDYIASAHISLAGDGKRMRVVWSTQQYDESNAHAGVPWLRAATTAAWVQPAGSVLGTESTSVAFTATSIAALDASLALVADATLAPTSTDVMPLWPATGRAVVYDGTDLRPMIGVGDRIWCPAPPAE